MIRAKVCGLTTAAAVDAALAGGAGWLGFMVFPASPRDIAPDAAAHLARPARGRAAIVAVTVDPDDALIERIAAVLKPDFIQLHGRESPARVREVAARAGAGVIKAVPVAEAADVAAARGFEAVADHLMLDAKAPGGADRPGGLGAPFDWTLTAGLRLARPWFLAGGLDAWNVAQAVRLSGAPMVDVSSGVERGPGYKDPALITAFLEAVRRA
ncbi:MAG: phosphoribosylanthranilate isomerase [Caulobacteraceae bacterium]